MNIVDQLLTPYHLPLAISLAVFVVFALVGAMGVFDSDVGLDVDADVDMDADLGEGGGSIFNGLLKFLNASDIPLLMILAMLNTLVLGISLLLNQYFNADGALWLALLLYIPNFVVSCILVHYITLPMKSLFRQLKDDEPNAPIVGRVGIVKSLTMDHEFGQVEVPNDRNAPARIMCVVGESHKPLKKGDKVVVTSKIEGENKFVAVSFDSIEEGSPLFEISKESEIINTKQERNTNEN